MKAFFKPAISIDILAFQSIASNFKRIHCITRAIILFFTTIASFANKTGTNFSQSEAELKEKEQKEREYLLIVCPFCDKKFCKPYFTKKYIEFSYE